MQPAQANNCAAVPLCSNILTERHSCNSKFVIISNMINYNPKGGFSFIFRFHKADTIRKLTPAIIIICFYTWLVVYLELSYLRVSNNSSLKNIPTVHSLLGFAISILLVFRTNTAYDRWWEGRKLW